MTSMGNPWRNVGLGKSTPLQLTAGKFGWQHWILRKSGPLNVWAAGQRAGACRPAQGRVSGLSRRETFPRRPAVRRASSCDSIAPNHNVGTSGSLAGGNASRQGAGSAITWPEPPLHTKVLHPSGFSSLPAMRGRRAVPGRGSAGLPKAGISSTAAASGSRTGVSGAKPTKPSAAARQVENLDERRTTEGSQRAGIGGPLERLNAYLAMTLT